MIDQPTHTQLRSGRDEPYVGNNDGLRGEVVLGEEVVHREIGSAFHVVPIRVEVREGNCGAILLPQVRGVVEPLEGIIEARSADVVGRLLPLTSMRTNGRSTVSVLRRK